MKYKCKWNVSILVSLILIILLIFLQRYFLKPTLESFNETILIEDSIYGKFKCFKHDSMICKSILTTKSWEKHLLDKLIEHYKKDTVFLDIGSNYGCHSMGIANEIKKMNGHGKVHSF
jgi:hypothetical protein